MGVATRALEEDIVDEQNDRLDKAIRKAVAEDGVSRRTFLRSSGGFLIVGGLSLPAILAACAQSGSSSAAESSAPTAAASSGPTSAATSAASGGTVLNDIFGPGGKEAGQGLTVVHGMNLAMTGGGSFYGEVMSGAAKLAAKQIKEAGGPDFKIVINDHQSGLVPPSVNGVRKLIDQDGIETFSASYAAPTIPILPLLEAAQILSLQGGGTNPDVLGKPFHFLTAMIFAVDPVDGALEFFHKTYPDAKRIVFTGTLENGAVAIKERGPAAWMKLVPDGVVAGTEIHELLITDFSALVARVKQENPDVIFTTSFADDLGYEIKALREAGVKAPIMTIDMTSNVPKLAGPAIGEDVYLAVDYYDVKNPNPFNVQFVEAHNKEYGKDPEYFGANFYEHLFILWDTVRQTLAAGKTVGRGTDMRDTLVANNLFKTVYGGDANTVGTGAWDLNDHTCSKPMGVYKLAADGSLTFMETIKKNQVLG